MNRRKFFQWLGGLTAAVGIPVFPAISQLWAIEVKKQYVYDFSHAAHVLVNVKACNARIILADKTELRRCEFTQCDIVWRGEILASDTHIARSRIFIDSAGYFLENAKDVTIDFCEIIAL